MSNHPTIAALKAALESESKGNKIKYDEESFIISLNGKEIGQWNDEASHDYPEDLIWRRDISGFYHQAFKAGHEAATERLMTVLEQALDVIEFYSWIQPTQFPEGYYEPHYSPGVGGHDRFGTKAREFLLSIRETVADATTLADTLGEMKNEIAKLKEENAQLSKYCGEVRAWQNRAEDLSEELERLKK